MFDRTIGARSEGSMRGPAKHEKRKYARQFDARIWLAAIALSVIGMGIWFAVVSYNRTHVSGPQVTSALEAH